MREEINLDDIGCESCKIWQRRYNTKDICPHCLGIETDKMFIEFDTAFREIINGESK